MLLKRIAILVGVAAIISACNTPLPDDTQARVVEFSLDKTEAAKGETVTATWSLTGQAHQVKIQAIADTLLSYNWSTDHPDSGIMTFTVPISLATLSPIGLLFEVDGRVITSTALLIRCDHAWFFTPRPPQCPYDPVKPHPAILQTFERGWVIRLEDTKQVFLLRDDGERWGVVFQSIAHMGELGKALADERKYTACYSYSAGTASQVRYINDPDGRILAMSGHDLLDRWAVVENVKFIGCNE